MADTALPPFPIDPMEIKTVSSQDEADSAVSEAESRGMKLAAISNAGLPAGHARLTFLPQSAFKQP